jgi:diguanylate cyclase (GGDEF)-like protein/PAS domain S-box-containing protein
MKPARILVVEDEMIIARELAAQLRMLGYEPVGHAARGEQAVSLAGELLPDLVLMDIQLAGDMDGIAAAQAIHDQFDVPVIFVTAFATDEMLSRARITEPYGYILKPYSEREIHTVIQMALYKHQADHKLRQSAASLQESAQHTQAILDNMVDAVITINAQGVMESFNLAASTIFGYSANEAIGRNVSMLMPEPHRGQHDGYLAHYRDTGQENIIGKPRELDGRRKDGSVFPMGLSISRITRADKPVFVGLIHDISVRRAAEAQIRKLSLAVEQSPEMIVITDLNGAIEYVNKAYVAQTGYSLEEVKGHNTSISHSGDTPPETYTALWETLRRGAVWTGELYNRRKDGTGYVESAVMAPLRQPDGSITHYVAVLQDITARKQVETDLKVAAVAFESQEGMLIADANGLIQRVNQAFTTITGYSAEEVIGKNPSLLQSGRQGAAFYKAMWDSINSTGAWVGEIWNRRKSGDVYPEHLTITAVKDSVGAVTHYVASLTDITMRKAAADEIQHLAFYDLLTDLPNRRLFLDRLKQALTSRGRTGKEGALLFIDLDDFKTLNDTLGHDIGDLLLQQVAQRIESCVREGDTLARLGGDEFVVMLENLNEEPTEAAAQTEVVGAKILAAINQPYQLDSHNCHATASIGAALFNDHQSTIEELLKQSDIAMYQAKASGRNQLRFFDQKMQDTINTRVVLEGELRQALERQQFKLYYQLQVTHDRQIVSVEVLIRWQHPERGIVSPLDFIPMAEETGLILPIGQWVLETACTQLMKWQDDPLASHLLLAVNVSARQFHQPDFVEQVRAVLDKTGLDPSKLKLELTESVVLDDIDDTVLKMNALRAIGVGFSMDDFGTGFSSLAYLTRLPLSQLKIDQSFVHNLGVKPSDAVIVQTIIGMAKNLNLAVIAEGVETEDQRAFLELNGCPLCQGYLFSKPVPLAEFEALLKKDFPA